MKKLPIPPFAWPIPIAALVWLLLHWLGYDTHTVDGILFALTVVTCILIGVLGSRRESLNDRAGK